jgi:ankyrin repeat protein
MVAAGKGRVDDVSYLLSLGADTSIEARNGDTALDWAQNNGHANVVVAIETHRLQEQSQVAAAEAVLLQKYLYSVDQV